MEASVVEEVDLQSLRAQEELIRKHEPEERAAIEADLVQAASGQPRNLRGWAEVMGNNVQRDVDQMTFFKNRFIGLDAATKQALLTGDMSALRPVSRPVAEEGAAAEIVMGKTRKRRRKPGGPKDIPSLHALDPNFKKLPPLSQKIDAKEAGSIGLSTISFEEWRSKKKAEDKQKKEKLASQSASDLMVSADKFKGKKGFGGSGTGLPPKKQLQSYAALDPSPLLHKFKVKEQKEQEERAKQREIRRVQRRQQRQLEHEQQERLAKEERERARLDTEHPHRKHAAHTHQVWTVQEVLDMYRLQTFDFDAEWHAGLHWDHDREREFIVSVLQGSFIPELRVATATHHRVAAEEVEELTHKHEDIKRKVYQRLTIPLKPGEQLFRYPPHLRCKRPTSINLEPPSKRDGDESDDDSENFVSDEQVDEIEEEVSRQEAEAARFKVDRSSAPELQLEHDVMVVDVVKGMNRIHALAGFYMNKFPCNNKFFSAANNEDQLRWQEDNSLLLRTETNDMTNVTYKVLTKKRRREVLQRKIRVNVCHSTEKEIVEREAEEEKERNKNAMGSQIADALRRGYFGPTGAAEGSIGVELSAELAGRENFSFFESMRPPHVYMDKKTKKLTRERPKPEAGSVQEMLELERQADEIVGARKKVAEAGGYEKAWQNDASLLFVQARRIGTQRALLKVRAEREKSRDALEFGRLTLTVQHASNLASDGVDKSDPFCCVYWNQVRIGHTAVQHNMTEPKWAEKFDIALPYDVSECSLRVEVMDKDYTDSDEFLGQTTIEGVDLVNYAQGVQDYQLHPKNNEENDLVQGSLGLKLMVLGRKKRGAEIVAARERMIEGRRASAAGRERRLLVRMEWAKLHKRERKNLAASYVQALGLGFLARQELVRARAQKEQEGLRWQLVIQAFDYKSTNMFNFTVSPEQQLALKLEDWFKPNEIHREGKSSYLYGTHHWETVLEPLLCRLQWEPRPGPNLLKKKDLAAPTDDTVLKSDYLNRSPTAARLKQQKAVALAEAGNSDDSYSDSGSSEEEEELDWGAKSHPKAGQLIAAPVHSAFELKAQNLLKHEMGGVEAPVMPGSLQVEVEEEEVKELEVTPPWKLDQQRLHKEARHHHHHKAQEMVEAQPPPPPHNLLSRHPDFHPDVPHTWPISRVRMLHKALWEQMFDYVLAPNAFSAWIHHALHEKELVRAFPAGCVRLVDMLWRLYDPDGDGTVPALEVLCGLILVCRASVTEKLELLFSVFDFNSGGTLTFDEMVILLTMSAPGFLKILLLDAEAENVDHATIVAAHKEEVAKALRMKSKGLWPEHKPMPGDKEWQEIEAKKPPPVPTAEEVCKIHSALNREMEIVTDEAFLMADDTGDGEISSDEFVGWAMNLLVLVIDEGAEELARKKKKEAEDQAKNVAAEQARKEAEAAGGAVVEDPAEEEEQETEEQKKYREEQEALTALDEAKWALKHAKDELQKAKDGVATIYSSVGLEKKAAAKRAAVEIEKAYKHRDPKQCSRPLRTVLAADDALAEARTVYNRAFKNAPASAKGKTKKGEAKKKTAEEVQNHLLELNKEAAKQSAAWAAAAALQACEGLEDKILEAKAVIRDARTLDGVLYKAVTGDLHISCMTTHEQEEKAAAKKERDKRKRRKKKDDDDDETEEDPECESLKHLKRMKEEAVYRGYNARAAALWLVVEKFGKKKKGDLEAGGGEELVMNEETEEEKQEEEQEEKQEEQKVEQEEQKVEQVAIAQEMKEPKEEAASNQEQGELESMRAAGASTPPPPAAEEQLSTERRLVLHSTVSRSTLRLPLSPVVRADLLLRVESELPRQMRFIAWRVDDEDDDDGSALARFGCVASAAELTVALGTPWARHLEVRTNSVHMRTHSTGCTSMQALCFTHQCCHHRTI
jgi:Ca2+-binding EF-hand superfamily protein